MGSSLVLLDNTKKQMIRISDLFRRSIDKNRQIQRKVTGEASDGEERISFS